MSDVIAPNTNTTVNKKRGLGRGLSTLLSDATLDLKALNALATHGSDHNKPDKKTDASLSRLREQITQLAITQLQPGKYQPRQEFSKDSLAELAESIRAQGIIQPIVIRPVSHERYEIIAGERRWRAAQLAGLHDVPVIIREVPDEAAIAMALIENIQREDLNPLEEATALKRLQEEFELTQQQVAEAIGKSRVTVTNLLRLLDLHPEVKSYLQAGQLEQGHAKVLLGLAATEQPRAALIILQKNLTVRDTERLVHQWHDAHQKKNAQYADPNIGNLERKISDQLGTPVVIQHNKKGRGKLVIHYRNLDILDGILAKLKIAS